MFFFHYMTIKELWVFSLGSNGGILNNNEGPNFISIWIYVLYLNLNNKNTSTFNFFKFESYYSRYQVIDTLRKLIVQ